jgi:hypothetical protein
MSFRVLFKCHVIKSSSPITLYKGTSCPPHLFFSVSLSTAHLCCTLFICEQAAPHALLEYKLTEGRGFVFYTAVSPTSRSITGTQ